MSRILLNIDRLVLNGFQPPEAKALTAALQSQLSHILKSRRSPHEWASRSYRTTALKLAPMPLEAGTAGGSKFGVRMAETIGKVLKP